MPPKRARKQEAFTVVKRQRKRALLNKAAAIAGIAAHQNPSITHEAVLALYRGSK